MTIGSHDSFIGSVFGVISTENFCYFENIVSVILDIQYKFTPCAELTAQAP